MACAVAAPAPEPIGDFPAWLEAQGVNAEVARAMDSELGIRDYGVLRACVGDGLVRAELLATARDRLPFGFYAVLRQVVKALRGAEPHDDDDAAAASSPCGDVTLAGLVDVLLELFSGLSRELLLCVQRLNEWDGVQPPAASSATDVGSLEDATTAEMDYDELEEVSAPVVGDFTRSLTVNRVKMEPFEDAGKDFANPVPVPRPSEIGSVAQTTNEPLGKRPLAGYANLIAQNMASQPAARTTAALAAGIRPRPWPWQRQQQQEAAETHGEETAAASVARCDPPTRRRPFAPSDATAGGTFPPSRGQALPADGGDDAPYAFHPGKPLGPPEGAGERPSWREPCGPRRQRRRRAGERPCRCEARGRTFSRGCRAKPRVRAHAGDRSYRCDVCGKVFTRATVLRFHQRLHADDSP
ncbi:uncharacterized protein LOC116942914 [Petromyzon marinus]|uniref:uncharacterized protein LOC116942914 n=1 Tax=Petromyzon marinus TaxID=7757 RepID=UPI003F708C68